MDVRLSDGQPKLLGRVLQGRHVPKEDLSYDDRLQLALIPRVRDEQIAKRIERASGDIPVDPEEQIIEVVVMEDLIQGIVPRLLGTGRQVELCLGNQVRRHHDVMDQLELMHVFKGKIDGVGVEIGPRGHYRTVKPIFAVALLEGGLARLDGLKFGAPLFIERIAGLPFPAGQRT
jgi:hypothetical protein